MSALIEAVQRRTLTLPKKSRAVVGGQQIPSGLNPRTKAAIEWLRSLPCGEGWSPFRVGIRSDLHKILPVHITRSSLSKALLWWTHQREYLKSCARVGAHRVGIDGVATEPVSAEHQQWARSCLEETK